MCRPAARGPRAVDAWSGARLNSLRCASLKQTPHLFPLRAPPSRRYTDGDLNGNCNGNGNSNGNGNGNGNCNSSNCNCNCNRHFNINCDSRFKNNFDCAHAQQRPFNHPLHQAGSA